MRLICALDATAFCRASSKPHPSKPSTNVQFLLRTRRTETVTQPPLFVARSAANSSATAAFSTISNEGARPQSTDTTSRTPLDFSLQSTTPARLSRNLAAFFQDVSFTDAPPSFAAAPTASAASTGGFRSRRKVVRNAARKISSGDGGGGAAASASAASPTVASSATSASDSP